MTLDDYRKEKDLSYENLARLLKFTTSKTFRLCTYAAAGIKLVDAHAIQIKTMGVVSIQDLLPGGSNNGSHICTD